MSSKPPIPIQEISNINSIFCLVIGGVFNMIVIWLVFNKTPKEMSVYSKIILQTCFCDLALLMFSFIAQPVIHTDGG